MRVAANSRIMHKLATTGKLLGTSIISDYSSYKVKLTELLKSSGRVCSKNTVFAGEATLNFFILAFSSNAELWVLPNQHRKKFLAENISQQKAPTIYRQFKPPQDVSGLIFASNVCVLCLIVSSLTLSMHMLIRLGIFDDFARLYVSPPVMYSRCLPS